VVTPPSEADGFGGFAVSASFFAPSGFGFVFLRADTALLPPPLERESAFTLSTAGVTCGSSKLHVTVIVADPSRQSYG
jgi:hypothetical protein